MGGRPSPTAWSSSAGSAEDDLYMLLRRDPDRPADLAVEQVEAR